jgi:hypothetical protein
MTDMMQVESNRFNSLLDLVEAMAKRPSFELGPSSGDDAAPPPAPSFLGPSIGDDNIEGQRKSLGPSVGDDGPLITAAVGPCLGDDNVQGLTTDPLGPCVGDDAAPAGLR